MTPPGSERALAAGRGSEGAAERRGAVLLSAARVDALRAALGSPLYVYELDRVAERMAELRGILPEGSELFYSLKANPLPVLVAEVRALGAVAEVSSTGELAAAVGAGHPPERMIYSGPGKTAEEIDAALAAGVRHLSTESWADLARIEAAAEAAGVDLEVLLRVNPAEAPKAKLSMSGVASQFGFEEHDLLSGGERLAGLSRRLHLAGVHVYFGTQVGGREALAATFAAGLETAERVAELFAERRLGRGGALELVDLGGGFPWPFASADPPPDLTGLGEDLAALSAGRRRTAGARLVFESGRYLSASSGTLVATVLDVKESKGRRFVVLDSGIHHLGGMSGLGRIPRPAVFLRPPGGGEAGPAEAVPAVPLAAADVVGPLCSPLDCVARGAQLPPVAPGDALVVPNVGAYGLTASLVAFLSRPAPVEVALRGGRPVAASRLRGGHEPVSLEALDTMKDPEAAQPESR